MDVRSMHYDFKQKFNKIDSQQYRNLRIPEIDWMLNEACDMFIKSIAEPRVHNHLGFEVNQRTIDDLRTIVRNDVVIQPTTNMIGTQNTGIIPMIFRFEIPEDYMFFVSAYVTISKEGCKQKTVRLSIQQHDDEHEEDSFVQSSYEWGEVNARFVGQDLRVFGDGTFEVTAMQLNYIRKHKYIHNAQDFLPSASYKLPSGQPLIGSQNCELPEHTHREIVDIAVLIASGNLGTPDYQQKQAKLNLNQII